MDTPFPIFEPLTLLRKNLNTLSLHITLQYSKLHVHVVLLILSQV